MRCPECKAQVPDDLCLCPECGEMVQDTRPTRRFRLFGGREKTRPVRAQRPKRGSDTVPVARTVAEGQEGFLAQRPTLRIVLLVIIALAVLALSVLLGGYLGLHQGEIDRQENRLQEAQKYFEQGEDLLKQGDYRIAVASFQQALKIDPGHAYAQQRIDELVDQRYQIGLDLLNNGHYELAIAEFEYVLQIEPDHAYAPQGIEQAEARLAASLTPTPIDTEALKNDLYQQAVTHYEAEEWESATVKLEQLRALDPSYQADTVEEMLFQSHYNAGTTLLEQDRFEEGIFHLDQVITMRPSDPLSAEAEKQRTWAELYMTAMGYWEADWELCIARFETLYSIAPDYKDVYQRLTLAHVAYGDEWYAKNEMCPAEEQYTLALNMGAGEEVENKRNQAAEICLVATPTPVHSLAGTDVITLTELPRGFATGRLAYPLYNTTTRTYDVYVLSTDKRIVKWAAGGTQPTWVWNTRNLGYRDLTTPGISLRASETAGPQQLRSDAGLTWPTFSPDGGRVAYAAQDASSVWQIYIAPVDGSTEPQVHAQGQWPTWANNGWLAWTGCDAGDCGIFIDNPDDNQTPTQLSTSTSDIALSWHPDGGSLIYMADHTGNWEIFRVYTDRRFVQLTDDPAADGLPVWSPDGSKIAFVSKRDGEWGVYLMDASGQDPHVILKLGADMPSWSSQRLAWGP